VHAGMHIEIAEAMERAENFFNTEAAVITEKI
jgi:hypothetical protein